MMKKILFVSFLIIVLSLLSCTQKSGEKDNIPKAPGMKYKHYSPKASVFILSFSNILNKKVCDLPESKIVWIEA